MEEAERAPGSRIAKPSTRRLRPRVRGLLGGGTVLAACLVIGVATAAPLITWNVPYTGSAPYLGSTVTWNVGNGANTLIVAPSWTAGTGVAKFYPITNSYVPPYSITNTHGYAFVHAGAIMAPWTCAAGCVTGVHNVNVQWQVTWNSTQRHICSAGADWQNTTNNQVWTAGNALDTSNGSLTGWTVSIFAYSSVVSSCPSITTAGQTKATWGYGFTGWFINGHTYLVTTYWATEVYAAVICPLNPPLTCTGSTSTISDTQLSGTLQFVSIT